MPARKPFLLRIDPAVLEAIQRWAADDLRSLNGQIEFLLRRSLIERGRWKPADDESDAKGRSTPPPKTDDHDSGSG
jgi:hypothetical protein